MRRGAAFLIAAVFLVLTTGAQGREFAPDRVIVKYRSSGEGDARPGVLARFKRSGVSLKSVAPGSSVKKTLEKLRRDPDVLYAEPDYLVEALAVPDDPYFKNLWGLEKIDMPGAWEMTMGSREIIVAVIDTGIDYTHPDLAGNMWINTKEVPGNGIDDDGNGYVDDVHGYDFARNHPDPMDISGHGTHCAGTIGALWNNGLGVAGVSPRVRLMALKFLNPSGYTSDAIRAIEYAVANGARILSNSWGGGEYSLALRDAIDMAGAHGITFVAAAGNDTADTDRYPVYPSCYPSTNIISVGASDSSDDRAYFSNYGKNSVDVFAPGIYILSTFPGNEYRYLNGTSMACPHVSGTAALLLSGEPRLQPAAIRDILIETSDYSKYLRDICAAGGRVNARAALHETVEVPRPSVKRVLVSGGDGDSLAEPGETLSVVIEIENFGNTLTDAAAILSSPGGEVEIISGSSPYPDTAAGFSSVNESPFIIRVRPSSVYFRESPLLLEIRSHAGGFRRTLEVPFRTGRECDILIVDDDGGSARDVNLAGALESLGYHVAVWSTYNDGLPPLDDLRPHVTLWHTGNMTGHVLSSEELGRIRSFLDLGGAFIISGSEWADQLAADPFASEYLRAETYRPGGLEGRQEGLLWLGGVIFTIPSPEGAADLIRPLAGAFLLAGPGGTSGSIVYRPGNGTRGPALSLSFDASNLEGDELRSLLERCVRKVLRPRIIQATPRDGAADIVWTAPRLAPAVEITARRETETRTRVSSGAGLAFDGLSNGQTWSFSPRAFYSDGFVSEYGTAVTCVPAAGGGAPLAPVGAITVTPGERGLTVSWTPSPDGRCAGYALEVWGSAGLTSALVTENLSALAGREFLAAADHGTLRVSPVDADGRRGASTEAKWEYRDVYPPDEASNIRVEEAAERELRVTWTHGGSADLAGYLVEAAPRDGEYGEALRLGAVTEVKVRNASRGSAHFIRIRAFDDAGNVSHGTVTRYGRSGYDGSLSGCGCSMGEDDTREASAAVLALNHLLSMLLLGFGAIARGFIRFMRRLFQ